jgi:aspartate ammonia-lyase
MVRTERDYLGKIELPDDAYYGVQTARALKNFPVSGITERPEFIHAYVLIKKAAALVNMELGKLDEEKGKAIVKAADDVLTGGYENQFPVDVFQAGAGTSFNMNINEVLANRALEILGRQKGDYDFLSPNDHVNMAQSTNDTFPTASHIAVIIAADNLVSHLSEIGDSFKNKGKEFGSIPKSGRTHLMDATPLILGHEFLAYASAIDRAKERIRQRRNDLLELAIGGTAVGTGTNAHPKYRERVTDTLSKLCSVEFISAKNSFEALQSRSQLAAFSGALKELALELIRIANDLRLLASGPTAGLAEIRLPAVQPGSSIMPGKINPVMAECLDMVAFQVVGNDTAVAMAAQAGQLDLNVMTPVMTYNILFSLDILNNYLPVFQKRCLGCIEADEAQCRSYLELNPSMATLLVPKIGFMKAAELAKEALEKGVSVPKLAVEKGLIAQNEADEIFDPKTIAKSKYEK